MLDELDELCAEHGLTQALHPHVGTLVETAADVATVLERSERALVPRHRAPADRRLRPGEVRRRRRRSRRPRPPQGRPRRRRRTGRRRRVVDPATASARAVLPARATATCRSRRRSMRSRPPATTAGTCSSRTRISARHLQPPPGTGPSGGGSGELCECLEPLVSSAGEQHRVDDVHGGVGRLDVAAHDDRRTAAGVDGHAVAELIDRQRAAERVDGAGVDEVASSTAAGRPRRAA